MLQALHYPMITHCEGFFEVALCTVHGVAVSVVCVGWLESLGEG